MSELMATWFSIWDPEVMLKHWDLCSATYHAHDVLRLNVLICKNKVSIKSHTRHIVNEHT